MSNILQPRLHKRRAEDRLTFEEISLLHDLVAEMKQKEGLSIVDITRFQINLLNKEYNNGYHNTSSN